MNMTECLGFNQIEGSGLVPIPKGGFPFTGKEPCTYGIQFIGMPKVRTKEDLSVVCFLWGDWGKPWGSSYVNSLYTAVQKHLSLPHRFICFTDRGKGSENHFHPGIEIKPLEVPDGWEWNHKKMALYAPDNGLTGRVLCLDLDMIILGNIDDIARYSGSFTTCASPHRRDKERAGGSIVSFDAGSEVNRLWNPLFQNYRDINKLARGSERIYYRMQFKRDELKYWDDVGMFPGQILSFKIECQKKQTRGMAEDVPLPDGVRIVYFHGLPRPHERLDLAWVKENWTI